MRRRLTILALAICCALAISGVASAAEGWFHYGGSNPGANFCSGACPGVQKTRNGKIWLVNPNANRSGFVGVHRGGGGWVAVQQTGLGGSYAEVATYTNVYVQCGNNGYHFAEIHCWTSNL